MLGGGGGGGRLGVLVSKWVRRKTWVEGIG